MLKRVIILPEEKVEEIKRITDVNIRPVDTKYLLQLDQNSHFALSFIKDRKINGFLRKFFKIYIVSMVNFYEYKETDKIIIVGSDDKPKALDLVPKRFVLSC